MTPLYASTHNRVTTWSLRDAHRPPTRNYPTPPRSPTPTPYPYPLAPNQVWLAVDPIYEATQYTPYFIFGFLCKRHGIIDKFVSFTTTSPRTYLVIRLISLSCFVGSFVLAMVGHTTLPQLAGFEREGAPCSSRNVCKQGGVASVQRRPIAQGYTRTSRSRTLQTHITHPSRTRSARGAGCVDVPLNADGERQKMNELQSSERFPSLGCVAAHRLLQAPRHPVTSSGNVVQYHHPGTSSGNFVA